MIKRDIIRFVRFISIFLALFLSVGIIGAVDADRFPSLYVYVIDAVLIIIAIISHRLLKIPKISRKHD